MPEFIRHYWRAFFFAGFTEKRLSTAEYRIGFYSFPDDVSNCSVTNRRFLFRDDSRAVENGVDLLALGFILGHSKTNFLQYNHRNIFYERLIHSIDYRQQRGAPR